MNHPILTKEQLDRRVSEMWERVNHMEESNPLRDLTVAQNQHEEEKLKREFSEQQEALQGLWNLCHEMLPGNPSEASKIILINTDTLKFLARKSQQPAQP